ncbi:MAG: hypothetical protein ACTSSP_03570 [Candidatus Asgardarchaeia archaeon]
MANVRYIVIPILYEKIRPWYADVIRFVRKREKRNFVKLNILDLCFECSRHKELLSLFDKKEKYFKDTEYWTYFKERGLGNYIISEKIEKFIKLYCGIKKRIESGKNFRHRHKHGSSIIITEDGILVDGGHRLSILKHLNILEIYMSVFKYKRLFSDIESSRIEGRNKRHRRNLEKKVR